jgi:hypothetical protein
LSCGAALPAVVAPGAVEDVAWQAWVEVVRGLGRFTGDQAAFGHGVLIVARRRAPDDRGGVSAG